jgi:DNA-binding transcriptional regulator YdaS (Cro superfamily)
VNGRMYSETRRRALMRAVEILGGRSALCTRLGIGDHSMERWLQGRSRIPDGVFCQIVDVIMEDDIRRAAQDRRSQPRQEGVRESEALLPSKTN